MGVLHHLEEVMSLPPLSPRKSCRNVKTSPSPLMHWGETCTYLSKHCFCFRFYSPFTSKNEQPSFFLFFFFFDMAICIFVFEIWLEMVVFVCLPALVWCCLRGALQEALWCEVCEWHCWWYWSLEGGEASFWLLPLRTYDSDLTMLFVFYCSSTFLLFVDLSVWIFRILL